MVVQWTLSVQGLSIFSRRTTLMALIAKNTTLLPYDIVLFSFYIKLICDRVYLIVPFQFNLMSNWLKCCKAQLRSDGVVLGQFPIINFSTSHFIARASNIFYCGVVMRFIALDELMLFLIIYDLNH